MDASLAKSPFQSKTISQWFYFLASDLGCFHELRGKFGSDSEKFDHWLSVIRSKDMSSIPLEIRKSFRCLEYAVAVHNIFVDCLMNSRLRITKENIGQIETSVKTSLEYFEGWFSEQTVLRRKYEESNGATASTARNWKRKSVSGKESDKESDMGRPPNRAGEVNRFVGWAIASLIKQQRKKLDCRKEEQGGEIQNEEIILQRLTLLESLRVFEHQILEDEEYLRKYYVGGFRLYNNGWLALVNPGFAPIGHDLVDIIAEAVTHEKLETTGEGCIEMARKEVWREIETKKIEDRFLQNCGEINMHKEDKLNLFRDLVLKVSNARFGYEVREFPGGKICTGW